MLEERERKKYFQFHMLKGDSLDCLQKLGLVEPPAFSEETSEGTLESSETLEASEPLPALVDSPSVEQGILEDITPATININNKKNNAVICVIYDQEKEDLQVSAVPAGSRSSDFGVNIHYLVECLKILGEQTEPFFSLDPADPRDLRGPLQLKRFHPPWLADTPLV